jgi:hypothetical protein
LCNTALGRVVDLPKIDPDHAVVPLPERVFCAHEAIAMLVQPPDDIPERRFDMQIARISGGQDTAGSCPAGACLYAL